MTSYRGAVVKLRECEGRCGRAVVFYCDTGDGAEGQELRFEIEDGVVGAGLGDYTGGTGAEEGTDREAWEVERAVDADGLGGAGGVEEGDVVELDCREG